MCCSSSSSCCPSCCPWIFSSRAPSARSCPTVTGRPLTRHTFLPSVWISRCSSSVPSASGWMPNSSVSSGAIPEKAALTNAFSAPVRISSRLVRCPSTALRLSITMDLPAPVSPVRALNPGANSISATSIIAIFSICSSSSIPIFPPQRSICRTCSQKSAAWALS